jgi:hypothetical protein
VGKTGRPIEFRMRAHFYKASRRRRLSPAYMWLAGIINAGKRPRVIIAENTTLELASKTERRWISRLRKRYILLNVTKGGNGTSVGVGRVNWTPEIIGRLGTVADATLAKAIGCERKAVSYQRECRGIPASYDRTNNLPPPMMGGWNKRAIPEGIVARLGTEPDYKLGIECGISKKQIMNERRARGIASYADQTGNSGRIKVGDPHRRWTIPQQCSLML